MKVLVTGSAGFIGSSLSMQLLERGDKVVGIDNHNDYYDPSLKEARVNRFIDHPNYMHIRIDIKDRDIVDSLFKKNQFDSVVNLAAQAGVRYSIENPSAYIDSNIVGFANILEACRQNKVKHLVMHKVALFMAQIAKPLFLCMIMLIIQLAYMLQLKKLMSLWLTVIAIYIIYLPLD